MKYLVELKKTLIIIVVVIAHTVYASAADLDEGTLNCIKDESTIAVKIDCTKIVYTEKGQTFKDFVTHARRKPDWQIISLNYFVENFNDNSDNIKAVEAGLASQADSIDSRYELILTPTSVDKRGKITAEVYLRERKTAQQLAQMSFTASGCNWDDNMFKDNMKSGGKQIAELFKSELKKTN